MFEKQFKLQANHTSVRQELLAGLTTFLTMSYIVFLNPQILHAAGLDLGAVFVATCLVAALGSFLVGVLANYPIAIAPGMALNVYFTFVLVQNLHFSWQGTLGNVFISGVIFMILTITRIRYWLLEAIPTSLNLGISVGIGFFIAALALQHLNFSLILHTDLTQFFSTQFLFFCLGLLLITLLEYYRVLGGIIISIIIITAIGILCGESQFYGIFSLPPSVLPTFLQLNIQEAFHAEGLASIFSFLLVALFDSTGTLVGLLQQKAFASRRSTPQISAALLSDSVATTAGALLGTSSCSPFIESAAGIRAGGRTGLTAMTVACLFLLFLFLFPLAKTIPTYAIAPALFYVGILMIRHISYIHLTDWSESIPSLFTAIMIPLSYSIADGVGWGIITYVLIKLALCKHKEVKPFSFVLFFIFVFYLYLAH